MTGAQCGVVRRRIAEQWPEATDLEVSPTPEGAVITMTIDGQDQWFAVTLDGPLLEFLLSRPKPPPPEKPQEPRLPPVLATG